MRQKLGPKKHALCEKATGRKYEACLVRGGTHWWATCLWAEKSPEGLRNSDLVNYKTGEWEPDCRDGKFVE